MLKTGFACLLCTLSVLCYGQRRFTYASPFAEIRAEQKRLDSLEYRNAYEYELADSTQPNGKRYLMGRYEYGVDGVVALRIDFGFDTDSTAWYYAYDTKGRTTQESMVSRRAIVRSSFHYNKKNGRLDSVTVNAGGLFKHVAKFNKDGTIGEFAVLKVTVEPDTSGKKKKLKRILTPNERIVIVYDTTKHPIADTTYAVEGQMKSANAYTYDDAGRMTTRTFHEPGMAMWVEEYFYDENGNLFKRIRSDLTTGERKHYVMFYR